MNQILVTKLKSKTVDLAITNRKNFFKIQFLISLLAITIFISFYTYNKILLNQKEQSSVPLINNYNISRLYSSSNNITSNNQSYNNLIIGIIEIPKINLLYPIFSELNDDFLKISPCKFYGKMPSYNSNLCIAGHNYDNNKFFSRIHLLKNNDKIIIYNNNGNAFHYFVKQVYETDDTDFSPIYNRISNAYELTLVTCNNLNNKRIIVKAVSGE